MKIYPAMDLLGGKVVRLHQGRYDQVTMYADDPLTVATDWVEQGAARLHIVDLDGSRDGRATQAVLIGKILDKLAGRVRVQVGGGVRNMQQIEAYTKVGVDRVVLGTAAVKDPEFVKQACKRFKVVVAVDAVDGWVKTQGWLEDSGISAEELAKRVIDNGATAVLYTDIRRDGTGQGPDLDRTLRLVQSLPDAEIIASGGVGSLEDLVALQRGNVPAVVIVERCMT